MLRRFIYSLLIACILVLTIAYTLPISPSGLSVNIAQGSSLRTVAKQLSNQGVNAPWWALEAVARLTGDGKRVKAGKFNLKDSYSLVAIWDALATAVPEMTEIKLIEGWTFKQFRQAIDKSSALKHDTLAKTDEEIMALLGSSLHPEGRFFPDTYAVADGSSDLLIYKAAFEKMRRISEKVWATRPADTPLRSIDDLLNLATIIEKETATPADRGAVASVFHNRLKIGMRLQTDPTVIYGMGENYKGRIRKIDLETDTPYNTYTRNGLPPTPIAAPSEASLQAAMHPESTPYFYFVAKGDGTNGSFFSTSLTDHNRAVAQYLANRRDKNAQQ